MSLLGALAHSLVAMAAETQDQQQRVAELRDCAECPQMVVISPGQFVMGSEESTYGELDSYFDERPSRAVRIDQSFAVSKFEITVGEYKKFVRDTAHAPPGQCIVWVGGTPTLKEGKSWLDPNFAQDDSSPVVCVNWYDAVAYTRWLTSKTGQPYRLLSEAEWEYVARAGSNSAFGFGDDVREICMYANVTDVSAAAELGDTRAARCANEPIGSDNPTAGISNPSAKLSSEELINCRPGGIEALDDRFSLRAGSRVVPWVMARCNDQYGLRSNPVGFYQPNTFGVFDTIGNVWEWVSDCYVPNYRDAPTDGSSVDFAECSLRVLRGGAWAMNADGWRAADRDRDDPDVTYAVVGFRVAKAIDTASPTRPQD